MWLHSKGSVSNTHLSVDKPCWAPRIHVVYQQSTLNSAYNPTPVWSLLNRKWLFWPFYVGVTKYDSVVETMLLLIQPKLTRDLASAVNGTRIDIAVPTILIDVLQMLLTLIRLLFCLCLNRKWLGHLLCVSKYDSVGETILFLIQPILTRFSASAVNVVNGTRIDTTVLMFLQFWLIVLQTLFTIMRLLCIF